MSGSDSLWSFASEVPDALRPALRPLAWQPGDRVGERYVIERELGRGAHGVVYAATEPGVERRVALKVLSAISPLAHERLRREARVLASLRHPALLRIHDAFELDDRLVLVLEYVAGPTLEQRLPELHRDEALALLEQVARGLGEAHRRGVVHRDVKPGNVLLAPTGPLLADFGLARALESDTLTRSGDLIGTPRYMAPEQLTGGPVGPPADVWALGVILYRVLRGELPFPAPNLAALVERIQQGPPRVGGPGIGSELEAVCQRALDPDPARRFPDAQAFAHALDLARHPVSEPPPAGRGLGRALGLAGAALVLGAAGAWLTRTPSVVVRAPTSAPPAAASPSASPAGEALPNYRALVQNAWLRGEQGEALEWADQAVAAYGEFQDYYARLRIRLALDDLAGARDDAGQALARLDEASREGRMGLAIGLLDVHDYERALELAERILREQPASADALVLRAHCRDALRLPGALDDLSRAIEADPGHRRARFMRSEIRIAQGRLEEALSDLEAVEPEPEHAAIWRARLAEVRRRLAERR